MKIIISILIFIIFFSNSAFSLEFKDENLDGFWIVDKKKLSSSNPDNKKLSGPMGKFTKKVSGTLVFYINGDEGIYFAMGESQREKIEITKIFFIIIFSPFK